MLEPLRHTLASTFRVVLASGSPRRKEILSNSGIPPQALEIIPSTAEENLDKNSFSTEPWRYAEETAVLKAEEVYRRLITGHSKDSEKRLCVVGSDTVVTYENKIYGKPLDAKDALQTLATLNGQKHAVYSGVCILLSPKATGPSDIPLKQVFHQKTLVEFDSLDNDVLEAYVATGEPLDKAGGYGIQALGGTLIKGIEGDYYSVMGFPLNKFCRVLTSIVNE